MTLKSTDSNLKVAFVPEEDKVVFSGSSFGNGQHALRLSVSPRRRIRKHWEGFCEINGAKAIPMVGGKRVGDGVSFYARMKDRMGRVVAIDVDKGEMLVRVRMKQYRGTTRYYEYHVLNESLHSIRHHAPAKLPKRWQKMLTAMAVNHIEVLHRWDRYQGCWVEARSECRGRWTRTKWVPQARGR